MSIVSITEKKTKKLEFIRFEVGSVAGSTISGRGSGSASKWSDLERLENRIVTNIFVF